MPPAAPNPQTLAPRRRMRRALLWGLLVGLLLVAQSLLVWLTVSYESARAQEEADSAAAEAAVAIRRDLLRNMQALQALMWREPVPSDWRAGAEELMRSQRELLHVERRDAELRVTGSVHSPYGQRLFSQMPRDDIDIDTELACLTARRAAAPAFSRTYFVPLPGGQGAEVIDLCVPLQEAGRDTGFLVGTFALTQLLDGVLTPRQARQYELSFVEGDGARLARAGMPRGSGIFVAERLVDLPGVMLQLRVDAASGRPSLIPNLATALVLGLSIALFAVVLLLARDVRRRAAAEHALAESLAFRQAMEDSLVTGLRARDLTGAITYVNPAFCAMVGASAAELLAGRVTQVHAQHRPPYWPPEFADEYQHRQQTLLAGGGRPGGPREAREGFETVFMRKNGERFPVMIYEAPLVDGQGRHTGWMSAVLDISAQRRMEELSRQQQDRLQATARLATVGEMASLLSHELNQPLAAIASYATGSLNMIDEPHDADGSAHDTLPLLRQALERIAEQAERAGRIIKSVHDFVRRREQQRETLGADLLIDAVMPLVRLQARKSGTRIELDLDGKPPRVVCDRTMLEQVLLNLTRNGIQAMETGTPLADRVLTLRVRQTHPRWVTFSVIDAGPGIAPDVAARLFTPFFTTRSEGMGLGLSLCRTVVEQHGGALDFGPGPGGHGTEFRFTLPAPRAIEPPDAPALPGGAENGDTGSTDRDIEGPIPA
jgi:two-component system, LuxR family, sensor histidine kinase DctS